MGLSLQGHLALPHGLQEGRLGAGGGPVQLVHQEDLGENGALLPDQAPLPVEVDPGEVLGEEVWGHLDPAEGEAQDPGQGLGEGGLPRARHVLQEEVPPEEEGGEGEP